MLDTAADPNSIFSAELERIPLSVRPFLKRERKPNSYAKTWENFGGAYHEAFEIIVEAAMAKGGAQGRLTLPLFYLCRHTLELEIKNAIIVYNESANVPPDIKGHSLSRL